MLFKYKAYYLFTGLSSMVVKQGKTRRNKAAQGKSLGVGKNTLFGRVGNTSLPKKKTNQSLAKKPSDSGLKFVGGRLILASDIGSQLRASTKNTNAIRESKKISKPSRRNELSRSNSSQSKNSNLVISLKDSIQCLKIRNLPIGTTDVDLRRVLQQTGNCTVHELKLVDLASGSSHAEVFAAKKDLAALHRKFNKAVIDGRRILTEISSKPELQ